MSPLFSWWPKPLRRVSSKEAQAQHGGEQQARRQEGGMFVRLANGKRIEIPDAEYAMPEGGRVLFLDKNRKVLQEFPWGDVVAHGRKK
jgi:hypothetical protein